MSAVASTFGPSYLKISGSSTNKLQIGNDVNNINTNEISIKPEDWMTINNWFRFVIIFKQLFYFQIISFKHIF